MLNINNENFEAEVLKSDKPVVVDFWAEWCGPCKSFAPVFEKVANEKPDMKFVKVNVDSFPELAQKLNLRSIPTLMIFNNGKPSKAMAGAMDKRSFENWISS